MLVPQCLISQFNTVPSLKCLFKHVPFPKLNAKTAPSLPYLKNLSLFIVLDESTVKRSC